MSAGLSVSAKHAADFFWGCCGPVVVRFNSQVKTPTAAMLFVGCLTDFSLADLLSSAVPVSCETSDDSSCMQKKC